MRGLSPSSRVEYPKCPPDATSFPFLRFSASIISVRRGGGGRGGEKEKFKLDRNRGNVGDSFKYLPGASGTTEKDRIDCPWSHPFLLSSLALFLSFSGKRSNDDLRPMIRKNLKVPDPSFEKEKKLPLDRRNSVVTFFFFFSFLVDRAAKTTNK